MYSNMIKSLIGRRGTDLTLSFATLKVPGDAQFKEAGLSGFSSLVIILAPSNLIGPEFGTLPFLAGVACKLKNVCKPLGGTDTVAPSKSGHYDK